MILKKFFDLEMALFWCNIAKFNVFCRRRLLTVALGLLLQSGVVSSGNAWERRSQSYFDSGNGVPRNATKPGQPALGELDRKHCLHQNLPI